MSKKSVGVVGMLTKNVPSPDKIEVGVDCTHGTNEGPTDALFESFFRNSGQMELKSDNRKRNQATVDEATELAS